MGNLIRGAGGLPDFLNVDELREKVETVFSMCDELSKLPAPETMRTNLVLDRMDSLQGELNELREIVTEHKYSNQYDLLMICQKCREDILKRPPASRKPNRSNKTAILDFLEVNYPEIKDTATKNHIAVIANPMSKVRVR